LGASSSPRAENYRHSYPYQHGGQNEGKAGPDCLTQVPSKQSGKDSQNEKHHRNANSAEGDVKKTADDNEQIDVYKEEGELLNRPPRLRNTGGCGCGALVPKLLPQRKAWLLLPKA